MSNNQDKYELPEPLFDVDDKYERLKYMAATLVGAAIVVFLFGKSLPAPFFIRVLLALLLWCSSYNVTLSISLWAALDRARNQYKIQLASLGIGEAEAYAIRSGMISALEILSISKENFDNRHDEHTAKLRAGYQAWLSTMKNTSSTGDVSPDEEKAI